MGRGAWAWLAAALLACGGGDDDECLSGDQSRPGLVCSSDGEWMSLENGSPQRSPPTTTDTAGNLPSSTGAECRVSLAPGTYLFRWQQASGPFDCPQLADDIMVVTSDGEAITEGNQLVENNCTETRTDDGCTRTVSRRCQINGCLADALLVLDRETLVGLASATVFCSTGSLSCTYEGQLLASR